jgi:hypothetical protein
MINTEPVFYLFYLQLLAVPKARLENFHLGMFSENCP